MPVIYSTASNDNIFPVYENLVSDKKERGNVTPANFKTQVVIRGKANVKNKDTFVTPKGVATVVTEAALACLKKDKSFMHMVANNYMFIDEKADKRPDQRAIDKVVKNELEEKDGSAQMTEQDFAKLKLEGVKAPVVDAAPEAEGDE